MSASLKREGEKSGESTDEHITIKVQGQDGSSVCFKIKKHTQFKKLIHAYCNKMNLSRHLVRFRFDGDPVTDSDTPLSMNLEEGDSIEVFQEQTGGGTARGGCGGGGNCRMMILSPADYSNNSIAHCHTDLLRP